MKIIGADRDLARTIARLLDVELTEWQEHLLQTLFTGHRQLPADEPEIGLYPCTADLEGCRCNLPAGHQPPDVHQSADGRGWT